MAMGFNAHSLSLLFESRDSLLPAYVETIVLDSIGNDCIDSERPHAPWA